MLERSDKVFVILLAAIYKQAQALLDIKQLVLAATAQLEAVPVMLAAVMQP